MLHGVRFASPDDRVAVAEHITDLAVARSVVLTPPAMHHTPERYIRPDGSSRLQPRNHLVYTTEVLLEAEDRLLEAGREHGAVRVSTATVANIAEANLPGRDYGLNVDQAFAVEKIATSGRVARGARGAGRQREVNHHGGAQGRLGGRARARVGDRSRPLCCCGTGARRRARHRDGEHRQVAHRVATHPGADNRAPGPFALNLSRNAYPHSPGAAKLRARVAAMDQAIAERRLKAGQLVIVDEASLAGTFALDELVGAARQAGSKILLVGDGAQLGSVEAGVPSRSLSKTAVISSRSSPTSGALARSGRRPRASSCAKATRLSSMTTTRMAASQKAPGGRSSMPSTPPGRTTSMPASRAS